MRTTRKSSFRHRLMGLLRLQTAGLTLQASCHRCRGLSLSSKVKSDCFRHILAVIGGGGGVGEPGRCLRFSSTAVPP